MVNDKPKITVLMTVYNGEKTLGRAIDSILSQAFSDFEFLIINDCSTDKTVNIINSYNDKRIILHSNEKNMGQTESLNIGLGLSSGEYIARMDADDYSFPERLEKQYAFFRKNPEYAVLGTDCLVVDESNNKKTVSKGCSEYDEIILKILYASPINHVSVLMKKNIIKRVGGYRPEFIIAADFDLWSRIIRSGHKITTIPEILTAYTYSDGSYSYRNKMKKYEELVEITYENIKCFSSHPTSKEDVRCVARIFSDEFSELSDEDRSMGQILFKNIIQNLRPELKIKANNRKIDKILCNNYHLAAYHLILDNQPQKARSMIIKCLSNNGPSIKSFLIYILTYFWPDHIMGINYFRAKYL